MRGEIRHLGTEHITRCSIEVEGREENLAHVPGCLDSGADGNVAPEFMMVFAGKSLVCRAIFTNFQTEKRYHQTVGG